MKYGHHPFVLYRMSRLSFWAMVCMFGVCCQTLDGANVVREARKTIKNARYEENGMRPRR